MGILYRGSFYEKKGDMMDFWTSFSGDNGNCNGAIGFTLVSKDYEGREHKQDFRATWMVVNTTNVTQEEMTIECMTVLTQKKLPELMAMLRQVIADRRGVDRAQNPYLIKTWYVKG